MTSSFGRDEGSETINLGPNTAAKLSSFCIDNFLCQEERFEWQTFRKRFECPSKLLATSEDDLWYDFGAFPAALVALVPPKPFFNKVTLEPKEIAIEEMDLNHLSEMFLF